VRVPAVDPASIEAPITIVVALPGATAGASVIALDPDQTDDPKKIGRVLSD